MIRPNRENMSSTSFWVMFLGSPLMYKLASLMTSELGRAYDTLKTKPLASVREGAWPRHPGRVLHLQVRESQPCGRRSPVAVRAGSPPRARQGPSCAMMMPMSLLFHSRESGGPWLVWGRAGTNLAAHPPTLASGLSGQRAGLEEDIVLPGSSPENGGGESWVLCKCDTHQATGQLDMESRWGPVCGETHVSAQY